MRGIIQANSFLSNDGFDINLFNSMLEEAYVSTAREPGFKTKVSFSPSSIGYGHGTCPRYWYHAFHGAQFNEKADGQGIANMLNGTAAHDRVQSILAATPILKEIEKEVTSIDPPIRGFVDVIIDWNGEDVIGEFKTAKEEVFLIRKSTNKPTAGHLLQVLVYMHILEADKGFILYENKNTQELWTIPVAMNEKNKAIVERTLDWMRSVYKISQDEPIPPVRPFTKSTPQCKYCPVFDTCWSGEKGELKFPALEVPKT